MSSRRHADLDVRRFLVSAVRSFVGLEPAPTIGTIDWVPAAIDDGVLAPVVATLLASGQRSNLPAPLLAYPAAVAARAMRSSHELAMVASALDDAGITWVTLKGLVLGELVYETPGVRDSLDLDLLVAPDDIRRGIDVLVGAGAQVMGVDWASESWRHGAECPIMLPHGTTLDLHWHTINRASVRRTYRPHVTGLLARRVRRRLGVGEAWSPDDLDFALHVLVHACLDGCARLRCLLDIQQCVSWLEQRGVAPTDLARRAEDTGVRAPALVGLTTTARVVDAEVTPWAQAMGRGTTWVRASSWLERRQPADLVSTPLARKMNRHVTPTTAGSASAVLTRERQRVRAAARGESPVPTVEGITELEDPAFRRWLAQSEAAVEPEA